MSSSLPQSHQRQQQHFGFSQIPVNPSFQNAAVNAVAVVPLLSSKGNNDKQGEETASSKSFRELMQALRRHNSPNGNEDTTTSASASSSTSDSHLLLTVPNSSLTRPGDWRYNDTPLKAFHWQHGCQRLLLFDGRPEESRYSHDRLLSGPAGQRDWIDLIPSTRRTAAVIGVLNMNDCRSIADLRIAEEELQAHAVRFSCPPFAVTQHGASLARDCPIQRLFVYDSFLQQETAGNTTDAADSNRQNIEIGKDSRLPTSSILAFPPSDEAHAQMMDLHLAVVISDLTVAIFTSLEQKIRDICQEKTQPQQQQQAVSAARRGFTRFVSSGSNDAGDMMASADAPATSRNLGIGQMAGLVNPDSKLAQDSPTHSNRNSRSSSFGSLTGGGGVVDSTSTKDTSTSGAQLSSKLPQLLTPLDDDMNDLLLQQQQQQQQQDAMTAKDAEAVRKRDLGRREKLAADYCLLAGSPLDAYERYLKAAELCKTGAGAAAAVSMMLSLDDPLWYASALEGCAAAHIAMAEAGGYSVDEYLENNFQLPEEIMALAVQDDAAAVDKRQQQQDTKKQTLPEVVFALCEEALSIINRHEKLCNLYAELLLKLALYCADASERHLRCRWGEGAVGCYAGEAGDPVPRWEKTTVSKLKFQPLVTKDGGDMVAINTHNRVKKVCELLSRAVSVAALDPATRMDVAVCSARLCLDGVKPTLWEGKLPDPIKLPRKAAYFAVVAAETVSAVRSNEKEQTASDLWLLATRLYSPKGNPADGDGSYGWASLRAFCFDCLSMQGNGQLSLEAAGQLMSLLGDLDPVIPIAGTDTSGRSTKKAQQRRKRSQDAATQEKPTKQEIVPEPPALKETSSGRASARGSLNLDDENLQEAISSASQFAKNLRSSYTNFTGASKYMAQQAKWAYDDPIPPVEVPFSDSSLFSSSIVALDLVWPKMRYEICSVAQKRCLDRTTALRRAIPTSSSLTEDQGSLFGFRGEKLPLYVSSAAAIQSESCFELDCVKKRVVSDASKQGSMATFYNPYANKKSDKIPATRVAEDEERAMLLKFGNRLALPLEIQRSQLVFNNDGDGRVKAAALSFVIPPKAKAFTVHFPFTVLSNQSAALSETDSKSDSYEVKGLDLTCFGKSFFLPIKSLHRAAGRQWSENIPKPASLYPLRSETQGTDDSDTEVKPRIETYPCQPRLQVFFTETDAPAETVDISLSDGEIFSVPSFSLNNYLGPSSKGKIECLEILAVGLPGMSTRKVFDSTSALNTDESESDFVRDLLFEASPPPLKIRTLNCSLNLDSVNSCQRNRICGANVTLQIAAAHNMGETLPQGATVTLQFRYRGICSAETEVWRKREVTLCVVHAKGPRISSIAFRPDLATESAFADLSRPSDCKKKSGRDKSRDAMIDASTDRDFVLDRVGLDSEVSVASSETYFVLTVANETRSVLTLTRQGGPVGGFAGYPLSNMAVRPGVSAKIPIVMHRLSRVDENGKPADVISELISQTSIIWESHKGGEAGPVKARGHIRIPPACLMDIVNRHPSFLSQICMPPCAIRLYVGEPASLNSSIEVPMGKPLAVEMEVSLETWVPQDVIEHCSLTMEFRCARKQRREDDKAAPALHREYVWAGKLRRKLSLKDGVDKKHCAKIAFCSPGQFAVSAFVRITRSSPTSKGEEGGEEVWWAPFAQTIDVEEAKVPGQ